MKEKTTFRIGELAKLFDIGVDSIRYYEEVGILRPKRDPINNYRLYTIEDVRKLTMIRELLGPRRNQEQWVRNINFDIKEMVETEGYEFANPGTALLLQDGKIDESLFIGDGLHPNNRGYELIAGEIASSNKSF